MPQNFLTCDRDQRLLLPPDLRDWLPDDHLAWFVIEAVEEPDLDAFYGAYRADGHGRAAHEPQMMVALLAYAYAIGERSSRHRAPLSRGRRLPGDLRQPDPRPRDDRSLPRPPRDGPGGSVQRVLGLCAEAGLVEAGVLAVDGTKLAASASNHANRSYEQIAREIVAEAGRIDAAEDQRYGDARGAELPEHLARRDGRRAWLRDAKERLERQRAASPEPVPRDRSERLGICQRRLVEDWQVEQRANRNYEAYRERGVMRDGRRFGAPPKPHAPPERPEGQINTTDPDSKNMKAFRGYVQGYNAQAVTTRGQIIVAAEIAADGLDTSQLDPMITAAERELKQAGVEERPEVVLADAGYWSNEHIDRLRERGIIPLVAADAHKRDGPRKTRLGGPYDFMRRALQSEKGAEPLLASIGHGRARLRRHQGEPVRGAVQTSESSRRPLGMATDRGHPQPPEAPPTHDGGRNGLSPRRKALPLSARADCGAGLPLRRAFVRQPRRAAAVSPRAWQFSYSRAKEERKSSASSASPRTWSQLSSK